MSEGFQDPYLTEGLVETSGRVILRFSLLQVISLSGIRQWKLWSLDIKNAMFFCMPQPDGVHPVIKTADTQGAGVRAE